MQHDDIESDPDDPVPFDDGAILFVGELSLPGCESAGVLVAGVDASVEVVEDLPEGDIGEVSDIDCDAELFDAFEEGDGIECQSDFAGGAAAVPVWSVVCESDRAKSMFVKFADGVGNEDRIGPFHGLDETEWGLSAACIPVIEVLAEAIFGAEGFQVSGFFHSAVPCEVCVCHGVAGLW